LQTSHVKEQRLHEALLRQFIFHHILANESPSGVLVLLNDATTGPGAIFGFELLSGLLCLIPWSGWGTIWQFFAVRQLDYSARL